MGFSNKTAIVLISAILALAIILFVYLGCACRKPWEGFEDGQATKPDVASKPVAADAAAPSESNLTPKEKELFEDLKENRITDQRLSELIKNGTINEKVVTKFLNQLTSSADAAAAPAKPESFYAPVPVSPQTMRQLRQ